tara:strand:+ start:303 stop:614 length:312 start_codon:yes stop_codon:yes gene_type:complete
MAKNKGLQQYTVQEAQNAGLGQAGYQYLTVGNTGTAVAGRYYVAITVLVSDNDNTAQIAVESDDQTLFPDTTFTTLPSGTTLYGRWNKVTLTGSGSTAILYKG